MPNKKEVAKIKKAARNIKSENHTFYITGKSFSCRWDGKNFIWTSPSGNKYKVTAKEVCAWITDGRYITDYCYDYSD